LAGRNDRLAEVAPLLARCGGGFADLIAEEPAPALIAGSRAAETIGRPLGAAPFLDRLAAIAGRDPRPQKRGRKPSAAARVGADADKIPKA
jgi:putative transposase